jgi:hypothetical protein
MEPAAPGSNVTAPGPGRAAGVPGVSVTSADPAGPAVCIVVRTADQHGTVADPPAPICLEYSAATTRSGTEPVLEMAADADVPASMTVGVPVRL